MKIIQAEQLASIADYRICEDSLPMPGPGEVRVKIVAAGVGYVDALMALGSYQVKPPLPHIPGPEASGWVDALGEGVVGLAVGDRVMATPRGAFAQF